MGRLFKEEFRKIISRRMVWIALAGMLLFFAFRLYAVVQNEYQITIDGKKYEGREAILMDQQLAREYAGPLTEEKVKAIYDRFGFYYYDGGLDQFVGNFCNEFITEHMTNYYRTYGTPEEIQFYTGEDWDKNAAPLLKGDVNFSYAYGWEDLKEIWMVAINGIFIILLIGISPIFSEEYTLQTARLLLTTKGGKKEVITAKLLAAAGFAVLVFSGVVLLTGGMYVSVFGLEGLEGSAQILGVSHTGYIPETIGGYFLYEAGLSAAGILLLTGITVWISSMCKTSFLAVILSLALFLLPVAWMKSFAFMSILGENITKAVNHFMVSMPVLLPMNWGFPFTLRQIWVHLLTAGIVLVLCCILARRNYRNYEG